MANLSEGQSVTCRCSSAEHRRGMFDMYTPRMAGQFAHRGHIGNLLSVSVEGEALWHFPDEDLAVVGGRGNETVVVGAPVKSKMD